MNKKIKQTTMELRKFISDIITECLNESIDENPQTSVGYHCSDVDIQNYDGEISEDYYDRFESVLKAIKNKFPYISLISEA